MIRLPPTTLGLGRSDLADFEKRRNDHRLTAEDAEKNFPRFSVARHRDNVFGDVFARRNYAPQVVTLGCVSQTTTSASTLAFRSSTKPGEHLSVSGDELSANCQSPLLDGDFDDLLYLKEDGYDRVAVELKTSLENISHGHSPSSPLLKDDFHYGGFIEIPNKEIHSDHSSPFGKFENLTFMSIPSFTPSVPCDVSTPQNNSIPGLRTFRTRMPLPRSPLFLSQNLSSSPEHRPTSGLTPRVVARVATHNTPGIMFAQPARRPPRRSPRALRHQTNSFSFDSSERASAAYEQDRRSSTSTNDSNSRPTEEVSLHEELRGSSLQSSRGASGVPTSLQLSLSVVRHGISSQREQDEIEETVTERIFTSTRLPLPPPFSTVSRTVSQAGSLPSSPAGDPLPHDTQTSFIQGSPNSSIEPALHSSPPTRNFPTRAFRTVSIELRQISLAHDDNLNAQVQSATEDPISQLSRSTSPESSLGIEPQTPSRSYQIYNDSLPPGTQPQTPAHLPESRHRSRYHPSYTAPIARGATLHGIWTTGGHDGIGNKTLGRSRLISMTTPVRNGRPTSPLGLMQGGFRGLYGGRENGDEEQDWADGIRFNNAETRLWSSRGGRNEGRILRETPEPEDDRVGRRS